MQWIKEGVNINDFMKPFKGSFKGVKYDSDTPPPPSTQIFGNHGSCKEFTDFISKILEERLQTGAVRLLGKGGEVAPPRLVLPLTVETSNQGCVLTQDSLTYGWGTHPFH